MHEHTAQIFERYIDQPITLPRDLRGRIEKSCGDEPVQLFAMTDLDASMNLCKTWIALTPSYIVVARGADRHSDETIRIERRALLAKITEMPGLSCTIVHFYSKAQEHPFATVRYTHRQRQAVGHILFVLQQELAGQGFGGALSRTGFGRELSRTGFDPGDNSYLEAMAHPVKQAQAAVSSNRLAIIWRLLGYMKPYRAQVTIGMIGATMMTLARLAPPFLTGQILDHAIRPFQTGSLPLKAAWQMAFTLLGWLIGTLVLQEIAAWIRLRTMAVLGEHVARDLRTEMYDHLHKLSVSFFSAKQTGSIISRVGSDSDRIWDFIAFGFVELSLAFLLLIGLSTVLVFMDWRLGLIMTLPLPALLILIWWPAAPSSLSPIVSRPYARHRDSW